MVCFFNLYNSAPIITTVLHYHINVTASCQDHPPFVVCLFYFPSSSHVMTGKLLPQFVASHYCCKRLQYESILVMFVCCCATCLLCGGKSSNCICTRISGLYYSQAVLNLSKLFIYNLNTIVLSISYIKNAYL